MSEEREIPEGARVRVIFHNGEETRGTFVRGPRGDGDAFAIRDHDDGRVKYVKEFDLMVQD